MTGYKESKKYYLNNIYHTKMNKDKKEMSDHLLFCGTNYLKVASIIFIEHKNIFHFFIKHFGNF